MVVVCSAADAQQARSVAAARPDDWFPDAGSTEFPSAAPAEAGLAAEHSADARYEAVPARLDARCAPAAVLEDYSAQADFVPDDLVGRVRVDWVPVVRAQADCSVAQPVGVHSPVDWPADLSAGWPRADCPGDSPAHSVDDFRAGPSLELRVAPAAPA